MNDTQSILNTSWSSLIETGHAHHKVVPPNAETSLFEETATLGEAALYLHISEDEVKDLIARGVLCSKEEPESNALKVSAPCMRAQKSDLVAQSIKQNNRKLFRSARTTVSKPAIDMDPSSSSIFERLELAVKADFEDTPSVDAELSYEPNEVAHGDDSLASLLENLYTAQERLAGATYRIGYLESQIDSLQHQVRTLPDYQSRAARTIVLECQNTQLQDTVDRLTQKLQKVESNWLVRLFGIL